MYSSTVQIKWLHMTLTFDLEIYFRIFGLENWL